MKITNILSKLIIEDSRFNLLYDKMVLPPKTKEGEKPKKGLMDFIIFKNIIFGDPTTKAPQGFDIEGASVSDMQNVKVGKYTQWLLKNFLGPELPSDIEPGTSLYKNTIKSIQDLFLEDLYKTKTDLAKYEKFKSRLPEDKRDINKLTPKELFDLVKDFKLEKTKASKEEKEKAKTSYEHPGGKVKFRGNKWTVVEISDKGKLGQDAAIFYGGNQLYDEGESNWCTSGPGLTHFFNYIKDGPLYVILPNDTSSGVGSKSGLPKERYQFHFPSGQFMNRDDYQINLVEYLNGNMSELKDFFKKEFAKGLVTKETSDVKISYPQSKSAKYIALYGFNDMIENLPTSITSFSFKNNSSKDNISFDLPKSISRLTNLETLQLMNCVKSIPESIKELKNLSVLNLSDNSELTSLPEKSILELPNLTFLTLRNSPIKMSEDFKEKIGPSLGNGVYYINN